MLHDARPIEPVHVDDGSGLRAGPIDPEMNPADGRLERLVEDLDGVRAVGVDGVEDGEGRRGAVEIIRVVLDLVHAHMLIGLCDAGGGSVGES